MNNNLRILLYTISIVLFAFSYEICDYLYFDDIDAWWDTKCNMYAIITSIVFIASSIGKKGILRFVLDIGVGFTVSNVVDRLYFNTTQFTKADIIMIIATFLFAIIDYKKDELRENN